MKRAEVESDLKFLGFLVMQNTLKPESEPVIRQLSEADIRCVMVTGDNLLTAVSVARDCQMIPRSDRVLVAELVNSGDQQRVVFSDAGVGSEHNNDSGSSTSVNIETNCHVALTGRIKFLSKGTMQWGSIHCPGRLK